MEAKRRVFYESPTSLAVEVKMSRIICSSPDGFEDRDNYTPNSDDLFN